MAEPGSWQPDPDDPERLRWRTDAGEWTDYTAAGSEVAAVPVKVGRKRRKWPWIVLACVVALMAAGVVALMTAGVVALMTAGVASELEDEQPRPAMTTTTTAVVVENDCNRKIGRAKTLTGLWLVEAEAAIAGDTLAYDVATLTYDQMQEANLDAYACTLDGERYEEAEAWADLSLTGQSLHDDLLVICIEEFQPLGHVC